MIPQKQRSSKNVEWMRKIHGEEFYFEKFATILKFSAMKENFAKIRNCDLDKDL